MEPKCNTCLPLPLEPRADRLQFVGDLGREAATGGKLSLDAIETGLDLGHVAAEFERLTETLNGVEDMIVLVDRTAARLRGERAEALADLLAAGRIAQAGNGRPD